jgi:hypothetical protein
MESNRILLGALLFIVLIVAINFAMFAIARGAAKGDSRWMSSLRDTLSKPMEGSSSKSMDELRRQIEALKEQEKKE